MDPLQEEEKNPGDSNLNSEPCEVNDKINEGVTPCLENNKTDEKDVTTSSLITDENIPPSQELLKGDAAENKDVASSFSITDEKNSSREGQEDSPNNNPADSFKSLENIEEGNIQGDATEILTSVDVTVTVKKETDVNDVTVSSITDEHNVPNPNNNDITDFFIAPEGEIKEEVPEIKTELLTEDKNQELNPTELDNKDDSSDDDDDDDAHSVDSSSDSSSSSSSTASSTSGSSSNDEMDVDNDDVGDVVELELPKKLSPVIEEKPEELKAIQENGENLNIPDFPFYRDNNGESSHDSASEDSTSSASDVEGEITNKPKNPNSSSRKNRERRRPRVKGEIFPEELPALENLNICVGDDVSLQMLGKITSVIMNIAVVRAEFASPIDQDSIVFLKDRTCIGKVHDIIGPVLAPFYTILLDKDNLSIPVDTEIYCAPQEEEYTKYVFMSDLKNLKGSDASWEHDLEPPQIFLDFSDDEQERLIINKNKCKNSAEDNADGANSASGSSKSRVRKWRKTGHKKNVNSNTVQDASQQRSMFAYNAAWPPGNGHGSMTSWPPPTPPPVPPTPPQSNFQPPNNPTFYPNGPPSHPTWYSSYPEPPQPPQQHPFQSPWHPHQNQSNLNPYQHPPPSRPPFIPPPPNQQPPFIPPPPNQQPPFIPPPPNQQPPFIPPPPNQQPPFPGQWRQPYHPQGPPRPPGSFDYRRYPIPRFSQPPQFPGYFP